MTLPDVSSTLTTVALVIAPLAVTFTLSPALSCGWTDGLGPGEGLGIGVGVTWPLTFEGLFAFELVSGELESHAATVSDKSTIAKSFLVMMFLHSY